MNHSGKYGYIRLPLRPKPKYPLLSTARTWAAFTILTLPLFRVQLTSAYKRETTHPLITRRSVDTHRMENEGINLLTMGEGINFYRAGFDFAWVPYGNLGTTFQFSLLLKF